MKHIDQFNKSTFFLSNFYPASFVWNGDVWPTSEHAYQAAKFLDATTYNKIKAASSPAQAKKLGKSKGIRADWDDVKLSVMKSVVRAKFEQNLDIARQLIETGDALLEEGNWWGDRFWGVSPIGSRNGENHLGKILMEVREELKAL